MSHYAILNEKNEVILVTYYDNSVPEEEIEEYYNIFRDDIIKALRTSYNTREGVHRKGGIPFRKNYAGIGYVYDEDRDAFIPPKHFESWVLNEEKCIWEPPIPLPSDYNEKNYIWDEENLNWIESTE